MARTKHGIETLETDLELDENIALQAIAWKIQRVGYGVLFLIPILALIGLFGNGFLSTTTIQRASSELEYEKLFRNEAKMNLRIRVSQNSDSLIRISFPVDYLSKFQIETVFPEPKENIVSNEDVHYLFDAQGAAEVVFTLIPQRAGKINGDVTVNAEKYHLSQFIYP